MMRQEKHCLRTALFAALAAVATAWIVPIASADDPPLAAKQAEADQPIEGRGAAANETLRGRVVYLAEAMQRLYGIKSVPEASQRTLALETPAGQLVPLVENVRGRAFRVDPRLRMLKDVELLVRRHKAAPAAQIIRVYSHEKGQRLELDYWCEICSIAMFELKACDCCQGDIELRRRPAPPKPEQGK